MKVPVDDLVRRQLGHTIATLQALQNSPQIVATLVTMAQVTSEAMRAGGKLLVAGNGGSAADAQHLVAEFVVRLKVNRPALRAIALTTDSSILTAAANDFGFEHVFERQVEALGQPGDVFLAISTSGNSANVVLALRLARKLGVKTLGLTGGAGGQFGDLCDYLIVVPSDTTTTIQEAHLSLEHLLCSLVEHFVFGLGADR